MACLETAYVDDVSCDARSAVGGTKLPTTLIGFAQEIESSGTQGETTVLREAWFRS
ncbi:MAG TPA: hypothetical protein VJ372_03020 [Pyrinomonadaceae bacterium]|jgi:hypothetical protein|nr:hypothetical protein [Pyrinomonadaceae bacterium]